MRGSGYYAEIEHLCAGMGGVGGGNKRKESNGKKGENSEAVFVAKKKKIIKIQSSLDEPKRGRGRPRKLPQAKMEMLASIPTSVSICL